MHFYRFNLLLESLKITINTQCSHTKDIYLLSFLTIVRNAGPRWLPTTRNVIKMIKIPQHMGNNRWFTCHRQKYLVQYCSLCLKWRLGKVVVKDLILKRIGIAKSSSVYKTYLLTNSVALVRKRTIPTERPPLVGDVSANICG
jgi:hypothetical protein